MRVFRNEYIESSTVPARVSRSKKAKFGHKQFQKRPNPANEKRPNKGQISSKKFVKIAKLKFRIS